ncbi:hypothetical protein BH10BAC2_BH10BAC2_10350 [soil metagenome]
MDTIIKVLRFTTAIIICAVSTKVLVDLLNHTRGIAGKIGNIFGTIIMYFLAYLVVRKYFRNER